MTDEELKIQIAVGSLPNHMVKSATRGTEDPAIIRDLFSYLLSEFENFIYIETLDEFIRNPHTPDDIVKSIKEALKASRFSTDDGGPR